MKKLHLSIIATACALAISACSSSGNGSSSNVLPQSNNQPDVPVGTNKDDETKKL
ncbi:hypothetical protein ACWIW6_08965 [Ursidibacter sp. B-7004-1]